MPRKQDKTRIKVAHMTFETKEYPRSGLTFAVYAGDPDDRKPNFSGFIEKGMAAELLKLSAHIRKLENGDTS